MPRFVDTTGCMPARRSHFWDRDNHPIAQLTIPPPFMAGDRDSRRGTAEDGLCRSSCSGAGCSRSAGSRRGCTDSRLALSADCGSLPSSPVVAERQHISACGATNLAVKLSIVNTALQCGNLPRSVCSCQLPNAAYPNISFYGLAELSMCYMLLTDRGHQAPELPSPDEPVAMSVPRRVPECSASPGACLPAISHRRMGGSRLAPRPVPAFTGCRANCRTRRRP